MISRKIVISVLIQMIVHDIFVKGCSDTVQIEDYSFKEITSSTPVPIDETTEIIIESQPKEKSYPKYQASEDSSVYLERYQEKWMVTSIDSDLNVIKPSLVHKSCKEDCPENCTSEDWKSEQGTGTSCCAELIITPSGSLKVQLGSRNMELKYIGNFNGNNAYKLSGSNLFLFKRLGSGRKHVWMISNETSSEAQNQLWSGECEESCIEKCNALLARQSTNQEALTVQCKADPEILTVRTVAPTLGNPRITKKISPETAESSDPELLTTEHPGKPGEHGPRTGVAIAGFLVVLILVSLAIALFVFFAKRKKQQKESGLHEGLTDPKNGRGKDDNDERYVLEPGTNTNGIAGNESNGFQTVDLSAGSGGGNNPPGNKATKIETDLSNTEILTIVDNPDYNL